MLNALLEGSPGHSESEYTKRHESWWGDIYIYIGHGIIYVLSIKEVFSQHVNEIPMGDA